MNNFIESQNNAPRAENKGLLAGEEKLELLRGMDMVANLINFHTSLNKIDNPQIILENAAAKLREITKFKVISFYLINEDDSSFYQAYCEPAEFSSFIGKEVDILIDERTFSLALGINNPSFVTSADGFDQIMLHPLLTPSRARGMFAGVLAMDKRDISDIALILFTTLMVTSANALESFELYQRYKTVNSALAKNIIMLEASEKELIKHREHLEQLLAERTQALKDSEEKYRNIFANAVEGIFQAAPDGSYISANPALASIFGYDSPIELIQSGMPIGQHIFAEPARRKEYLKLLNQNDTVRQFETKISKKGDDRWISVNVRVVRNSDQKVLFYEGTVEDITERKIAEEELRRQREHLEQTVQKRTEELTIANKELQRDISRRVAAEEALKKSEEKYRSIFENASEGIFQITSDGKFISANPALARIYGYDSAEELMQKNQNLGLHQFLNQSRFDEFLRNMKQSGAVSNMETQIFRKDGSSRWVIMNALAVRNQKMALLYYEGTMLDITDKKALEAQLLQSQKMEAVGSLAGGVAHDFNNILMAIIGYTEMALYKISEASPARNDLEQVLRAGSRATDLVKQILAFTRQTEQEQRPVRAIPIIQEVLKLLRSSLPSTIEIHQEITVIDGNDIILGDPTRIHQVLMNICTNAAHAMRESGGILSVNLSSIEIDAKIIRQYPDLKQGDYLKLTITDTGQGMDKAVMEKIFDPYFTTKGPLGGTGLGLAVVRAIVKSHKGAIAVSSEAGRGSSFQIFLPRHGNEFKPEPETQKYFSSGKERILFVDDEKALVELAQKMLVFLGYKVTAEINSTTALEIFRSQPDAFDLVITDMTMPNLTGMALAKELLAIRPDIPIILCTGFSELVSEKQAKETGIRKFVMKPFTSAILAQTIRKAMDETALLQQRSL